MYTPLPYNRLRVHTRKCVFIFVTLKLCNLTKDKYSNLIPLIVPSGTFEDPSWSRDFIKSRFSQLQIFLFLLTQVD